VTPDRSVIFEWSVHPPARGGYRRVVFIAALTIVPMTSLVVFEHPLWAFFATVFLLGSTAAYWLPTRFSIDHEGIQLRRWMWERRLRFADLKRVERDPNGLFVSPFAARSRLDGHRGMLLMEPPDCDAVLQYVSRRIAEAAGAGQ